MENRKHRLDFVYSTFLNLNETTLTHKVTVVNPNNPLIIPLQPFELLSVDFTDYKALLATPRLKIQYVPHQSPLINMHSYNLSHW